MLLSLKLALIMNNIIKDFNSIDNFFLDKMAIDNHMSLNQIYTKFVEDVGQSKKLEIL